MVAADLVHLRREVAGAGRLPERAPTVRRHETGVTPLNGCFAHSDPGVGYKPCRRRRADANATAVEEGET